MMIMGSRSHKSVILLVGLVLHMETIGFSLDIGGPKFRCPEKEREALLKFKQRISDHGNRLFSWSSEEDCCQWRGVGCSNKTGHVIKLDLSVKSSDDEWNETPLQGEISSSLLDLKHLRYLDLSANDFREIGIPNFIGSFTKLRYLRLSSANFVGRVPPQLGNASSLVFLDISGNSDDINRLNVDNLEWLSRLSSIKYIEMSFIDLSKAVDWMHTINKLPHLLNLGLRSCQLPEVPPSLPYNVNSKKTFPASVDHSWLFNVSGSLVYLDLGENDFGGGISRFLENVCKLEFLDLSWNNLHGKTFEVIQSWSGCPRDLPLEILNLNGNLLSGYFPDFTRFSSLSELYLYNNRLNGILPKSLGKLSKLVTLDLSYNSLEGIISEEHFQNLLRLEELDLSSNSFVLNLSSTWVPLSQFRYLSMGSCKIGHRFPKWLHTQKALWHLDFSDVGISDTIPNWFWGISATNLEYLNLSYNQIRGQVSSLSLKLIYLTTMDLSSNQFEGPLPEISSKLEILDLSKNLFSGSVSSLCKTMGANKYFYILDLSSNFLSGELPDCWIYWDDLTVLNLADNNLSGKIPDSMGSLWSLRTLHLRNNSLSGELPSSMQDCEKLTSLDLGANKLSGKLPSWIGERLSDLMFLYLPSNEFDGPIPLQLCYLTSLQILDLAQNNISGTIPSCFNKFGFMAQIKSSSGSVVYKNAHKNGFSHTYFETGWVVWKGKEVKYITILGLVKRIDLSSNNLSGEIPIEITTLYGLQGLNLSRNQLTGSLAPMIGRLWQLETLDVSRNQLSGLIPPSLTNLTFLSQLDLSYNDFSGKIPLSTQLQSFNVSSYVGNHALCGPPFIMKCPQDETPKGPSLSGVNHGDGYEMLWFYVSMVLGFVVGFWGFCGTLLLNNSWRHAYFQRLDDMKDMFFERIAVHVIRLQRKLWS